MSWRCTIEAAGTKMLARKTRHKLRRGVGGGGWTEVIRVVVMGPGADKAGSQITVIEEW